MVKRREEGYTLLEIVVSMVIFGVFLLILMVLTAEMRNYEKKLPVNFMRHPQVTAVMSRLRRDVLDIDGTGPEPDSPYLPQWPEQNPQFINGKQVLILRTMDPSGIKVVVWDFREPTVVTRRMYNVGVPSDWVARGLPPEIGKIEFDGVQIPGYPWAVRVTATDKKGRIAIDQIFQPRAHK